MILMALQALPVVLARVVTGTKVLDLVVPVNKKVVATEEIATMMTTPAAEANPRIPQRVS